MRLRIWRRQTRLRACELGVSASPLWDEQGSSVAWPVARLAAVTAKAIPAMIMLDIVHVYSFAFLQPARVKVAYSMEKLIRSPSACMLRLAQRLK